MKKLVKLKGDKVIAALNVKEGTATKIKGFIETEVERSEKGGWYLPGKAPKFSEEELEQRRITSAKKDREKYVSQIVVDVDGLKFDGDEVSQDRMARSIVALNENETVQWVLADNTVAQITKDQLRQALRLSGEAQTNIWANPYIKK